MSAIQATKPKKNKIRTVSQFSGVPTPTLRVWEARYAAFHPERTPSGQRLYGDEDILKATLLKRLTQNGLSIGSIATLETRQLQDLVIQTQATESDPHGWDEKQQSVSVVVVGLSLASRLESHAFKLHDRSTQLRIEEVFPDLDLALDAKPSKDIQVLTIRVNSLHIDTQSQIDQLIDLTRATRTIVLYNFGQQQVVERMKGAGITVRREPVSDPELLDLVESVLLVDARKTASLLPNTVVIPERRYSEEGLQAIARISTDVLCECPRHVAEIIGMLCHFEQYSHDCLNKSSEDAHLHALLKSVAGSCRAMFERAMESVANHEGIDLAPFRLKQSNEDSVVG